MRSILTVIVWLMFLLHSEAQVQFILNGYVYDSKTGNGLAYANISENNALKGTITDQTGFFSIRLSQGLHELKFTYVGYKNLFTSTLTDFRLLVIS